jgi:hypothetical protein
MMKSIWLFPGIITLILVVLVSLQISGSSIGIYHQLLYGADVKDSSLLENEPQSVRSDEWLVTTQLTIAQKEAGYPDINPYFNNGRDMSLVTDVPYLDWSQIFKVQNLAFFIMPFGFAFAFKWWILVYLLLISAYFFVLKILPKKTGLAMGAALLVGCSPFVFWWYQTITIAPLFYGFLILILGMNIIDDKKVKVFKKEAPHYAVNITRILAMAYLLISFGLVLYPPFQIPVAIVVSAFLLGYLINKFLAGGKKIKSIKLPLTILVASALLTGAIIGIFIATRHDAFSTINSTAYPGKRVVVSGGFSVTRSLTTYLQPLLQNTKLDPFYLQNKSEASNFILLPFFFILPVIGLIVWLIVKKRRIEWVLILLVTAALLFCAHLFLGFTTPLTKVDFLYLVPKERLIIGLGFVSIPLVFYAIRISREEKIVLSRKLLIVMSIYTLGYLAVSIIAGYKTMQQYPEFITNHRTIIILASIVSIGMFLILINKAKWGLLILCAFSIYAVHAVQPLYSGVGQFSDNQIIQTIKSLSNKNQVWASNSLLFENFPQIADRQSVTGLSFYPNNAFWKTYEPGASSTIYNRYAHVDINFTSNPIQLVQADTFTVSATCDQKIIYLVTIS